LAVLASAQVSVKIALCGWPALACPPLLFITIGGAAGAAVPAWAVRLVIAYAVPPPTRAIASTVPTAITTRRCRESHPERCR